MGRLASRDARWTAFGVLAAIQSLGRIAATVTAGALWTFVSPAAGLLVTGPLLVAGIFYCTLHAEETPRTSTG
ncbi:hypothetical protein [Pseudofrankia asymbiotica]|uniref:Uncharacterized protein n=1 Tax=Pseudofrankia asymbiotica TaxID=1834516 RepID=A0A1V2IGZ9_9ACTN|nr:hypothetical protein [Pseudofrankia asymbiotica]ONH32472.1 hypothetical protein BL253_05500 [Pseudofrankia asymbiotica]